MNLKYIILSFFLVMTFCFGTFAFAQSSNDLKDGMPKAPENVCSGIFGGENDPSGACINRKANSKTLAEQVRDLVTSVNNFLFVLAPSIAVIAIIIGAFNILQNGFKAGVLIIQWALIGMVIVLLSSALVSVIVRLAVGG
jgi:hypothetical protein